MSTAAQTSRTSDPYATSGADVDAAGDAVVDLGVGRTVGVVDDPDVGVREHPGQRVGQLGTRQRQVRRPRDGAVVAVHQGRHGGGDPDERLVALLTAAVSDTARFVGATREAADVRAEADVRVTA